MENIIKDRLNQVKVRSKWLSKTAKILIIIGISVPLILVIGWILMSLIGALLLNILDNAWLNDILINKLLPIWSYIGMLYVLYFVALIPTIIIHILNNRLGVNYRLLYMLAKNEIKLSKLESQSIRINAYTFDDFKKLEGENLINRINLSPEQYNKFRHNIDLINTSNNELLRFLDKSIIKNKRLHINDIAIIKSYMHSVNLLCKDIGANGVIFHSGIDKLLVIVAYGPVYIKTYTLEYSDIIYNK